MISLIFSVSILLTGPAMAQCSRQMLQEGVDAYIASVQTGTSQGSASYTENFKTINFKSGIHSKPIRVSHSRSLLDTTTCATYTLLIAPDNAPPMVIGTQTNYTGGKAATMETLFNTKENGWIADPKVTHSFASKEKRDIIPEDKRDSRKTIQAIGDAYLAKFSNSSVIIPHLSPCERLEGKMHVSPDCTAGIPSGSMRMTNRRYVIDEAYGTVDIFLNFGGSMPDSHEFRVEGGKLRYVMAITVAKA